MNNAISQLFTFFSRVTARDFLTLLRSVGSRQSLTVKSINPVSASKNKFRFGFRFFYFTTDILNVNPDVFTLLCSREYLENESMDEESGNISEEPRYKMCFYYISSPV